MVKRDKTTSSKLAFPALSPNELIEVWAISTPSAIGKNTVKAHFL